MLKESEKRFKFVKSVDELCELLKPVFAEKGIEDPQSAIVNENFDNAQKFGVFARVAGHWLVVHDDFTVTEDYTTPAPEATDVLREGLTKSDGKAYVKGMHEHVNYRELDEDISKYCKMVGISNPAELYAE